MVELEDELVRLKGQKKQDQAKLREVKQALREARQRFRSQRAGDLGEGDAAAQPGTVKASAEAKGV